MREPVGGLAVPFRRSGSAWKGITASEGRRAGLEPISALAPGAGVVDTATALPGTAADRVSLVSSNALRIGSKSRASAS